MIKHSELFAQIGASLGLVFRSKTEAVTYITTHGVQNGQAYFITSDDGGAFIGATGAAPATYADNGAAYCGTMFIASGGDGSDALLRQYSGGASFKWFGAIGDGSTDDTTTIQAAINSGLALIYIPSGTYNHTGLTLSENQTLYGDGVESILHNTSTGVSLSGVGSVTDRFNGLTLRDFAITGTASSSHGIRLVNATRANNIIRLFIGSNGGAGIALEACVGVTIKNNDIKENVGAGVALTEASDSIYCSANRILQNHITGNDGGGVTLTALTSSSGIYSNKIKCNVIESNNVAGVSGSGIVVDGAWKTKIIDNDMESAFDSLIKLTNASGFSTSETTIERNSFANSGAPTQSYDIDIVSANGTRILNNDFPASGPTASVLETAGTNLVYMFNKNLTRTGSGISNVVNVTQTAIEFDGGLQNTITGNLEKIVAKTADDTLTASQVGTTFTNNGAGGVITLTLPAASDGMQYSFSRINSTYALRIDPNGTENIRDPGGIGTGSAGKYLSLDTNGGAVSLVARGATGVWDVVLKNGGTLSFEP